ncbi:hypothetical protein G7062_06475 [Erysipelothrix sp. HDW6C]|uniref:hypothetical protein n=1 Tax=Erysipelothrix sp. HDW6C TaxID=2714930 RepID=UPI00140CE313|nr:hypothetical protein [Erysipelothrix sp. HDW6C]QIK69953.1 hypothetical protein G7062_06475 [Erysipelothrix sp. HDW6C]
MQKRKRDYDNQMVWLSGLYIRSAIGSCFSKSEYTEPINLDDIERRSEMTSEEILQEDQRHAVSLSQIQIARVMSLLNKERTEGSGDK